VMWVMSNLVSIHLEMVLLSVKLGVRFASNIPKAQESFWTHPMVLLGHEAQVEARFGLFVDIANPNIP
jgi:hypothetical protein